MAKHDLRFWMKCISCGEIMPQDRPLYDCIFCGGLLMPERDDDFIRRYIGDGEAIQAYFDSIKYSRRSAVYPYGSGVFRYLDFLFPGFPAEAIISLREGNTDLSTLPKWDRKKIGLSSIFFKMEGHNPTGSFKDRGMCGAVSEVNRLIMFYPELGIKGTAQASSGDTAAAAAAFSAEIEGIRNIVLMAHGKVAPGQVVQSKKYRALLIEIDHPKGFDGAMKIASELCRTHPELVLLNSKNPFRLIGQEAIALEIFQDLNWKVPRWISVPAGNGGNLTALMMSCLRAKAFGIINELPGIIIAQPKISNTLVRWERSGFRDYMPGTYKDSVASAMNIQDPVSFPRINNLRKHFEIRAFDVEEKEIKDTRARFIHLDPHGAVATHAVLQAREGGVIKENDSVVVIVTANDLKFPDSNSAYLDNCENEFANPSNIVPGTVEAVEQVLALA